MKNDLTAEYMIRFGARIAKPLELINFIDELENHEILQIMRELCMQPDSFSLIRHEALGYLTSAFLLKTNGVAVIKKSWFKRLLKR